MKIKKAVLRQGSLIDSIVKNQTEFLKRKAEKVKVKIDTKAAQAKNKVENQLKKEITKTNEVFSKIKEPKKKNKEKALTK